MTANTSRGVNCGNCHGYHASAEAVRRCYGGSQSANELDGTTDALRDRTEPPAHVQRPASWKTLPDVPAGLYAIPSLSGNNDLDFYKIDRPTEGKWAGYTFVKMVVGGHPDYSVRGLAKIQTIMNRIAAAGIRESAELYGREIGRCCKCNRTLTDDESRARGIGPECLKMYAW